jgi:hypothetical protein
MSIMGCTKNASGWGTDLSSRLKVKSSTNSSSTSFEIGFPARKLVWGEEYDQSWGYKVLVEQLQLTSRMPILMQGGMGVDRHVKPWRFFGGRMSEWSECISGMKDMAEMLGLPPTFRKKLGDKFFSRFNWIRLLCLGAHEFLRVARRRRCWKIFVNATKNLSSSGSE